MNTARLRDSLVKATYGTRAKYRAALRQNIRDRKAQTYESYLAGTEVLGLGAGDRAWWQAQQDSALAELRAAVVANS